MDEKETIIDQNAKADVTVVPIVVQCAPQVAVPESPAMQQALFDVLAALNFINSAFAKGLVTQQQLAAAIAAIPAPESGSFIEMESGSSSKISAMPVASSLDGSELVDVVQGGVNKQTTVNAIAVEGGPYLPLDGGTMTGAIQLGGSPALKYPNGNTLIDGAGNFLLPQNSGSQFYDQTHTAPANGQVMGSDYNANPAAKWIFPQYANGNPITDSSSNLKLDTSGVGDFYDATGTASAAAGVGYFLGANASGGPTWQLAGGGGAFLPLSAGPSFPLTGSLFMGSLVNPTIYTDGSIIYANGNTLADGDSNLYTPNGAIISDLTYPLMYNNGNPLVDNNSNLHADTASGMWYDQTGSAGLSGYVWANVAGQPVWMLSPYTPASPGDWSGTPPSTLADACDRLAAWIAANSTVFGTLGITTQP